MRDFVIEQIGVTDAKFAWMVVIFYRRNVDRDIFVNEVNIAIFEQSHLESKRAG